MKKQQLPKAEIEYHPTTTKGAILNLLEKDRLQQAIELLKVVNQNEASLLAGQLSALNKSLSLQIISDEDAQLQRNKIRASIMAIITAE